MSTTWFLLTNEEKDIIRRMKLGKQLTTLEWMRLHYLKDQGININEVQS